MRWAVLTFEAIAIAVLLIRLIKDLRATADNLRRFNGWEEENEN